jgi:hypothetical protein
MKRLTPVILIVIILALLFVSNPTSKDFSAWYGNQTSSSAPKALKTIGKSLSTAAASAYRRQSYGIFSVFSLTKGGSAYLGLAKALFIKVK